MSNRKENAMESMEFVQFETLNETRAAKLAWVFPI
jgi:hypothetical protein